MRWFQLMVMMINTKNHDFKGERRDYYDKRYAV